MLRCCLPVLSSCGSQPKTRRYFARPPVYRYCWTVCQGWGIRLYTCLVNRCGGIRTLSSMTVLLVAHGLFIAAFLPRPSGHPCAAAFLMCYCLSMDIKMLRQQLYTYRWIGLADYNRSSANITRSSGACLWQRLYVHTA